MSDVHAIPRHAFFLQTDPQAGVLLLSAFGSASTSGAPQDCQISERRLYTPRFVLKILIDSVEYKCWHEVGHATVCLHLGGDVDFIEFLDGDARGHARARCVVTSEIEKSVACGGFAAEVYLLNKGHAEQGHDDERNISQVIFHNATGDREDFWERKVGRDEEFTKAEDEEFMHHAIGLDGFGGVVPIFDQYFSGMQELVRELRDARRIEGRRV